MNNAQSPTDNPFATLGIDPAYSIDAAQIDRAHRKRLLLTHPDRVGERGAADSAMLNEARACLLDPEQRANALLAVLGGKSASEDKSLPDGFLMEMMQLREEIEEDLLDGGEEARERWQHWASSERKRYGEKIDAMFASFSADAEEATLDRWRATLNAWRYIERLIEQLDPAYNPAQADFN